MDTTQNRQIPQIDKDAFICMQRAVGYSKAIQMCYVYKKIMERSTKEDNDLQRGDLNPTFRRNRP